MIDWTSPQVVAFANFLGIGFLGLLAMAGKWLGMRKENAPPVTRDVAIDSVTIADRRALEGLTETLRTSNEVARNHREHDTAMLYELRAIRESNNRIESQMGRILDRTR